MGYEKQEWAKGQVITAEKLNHMESGLNQINHRAIHYRQAFVVGDSWCAGHGGQTVEQCLGYKIATKIADRVVVSARGGASFVSDKGNTFQALIDGKTDELSNSDVVIFIGGINDSYADITDEHAAAVDTFVKTIRGNTNADIYLFPCQNSGYLADPYFYIISRYNAIMQNIYKVSRDYNDVFVIKNMLTSCLGISDDLKLSDAGHMAPDGYSELAKICYTAMTGDFDAGYRYVGSGKLLADGMTVQGNNHVFIKDGIGYIHARYSNSKELKTEADTTLDLIEYPSCFYSLSCFNTSSPEVLMGYHSKITLIAKSTLPAWTFINVDVAKPLLLDAK